MKHKHFNKALTGVLLAFATLSLCSCDEVNPKDYQDNIDDYVTYQIAVTNTTYANVLNVYMNDNLSEEEQETVSDQVIEYIDTFDDEILATWMERDETFRSILEEIAYDNTNENAEVARDLLQSYKTTHISLSDYKKVSTSKDGVVWKFTEKNTGLDFTFTWDKKEGMWRIQEDDESMKAYINDKLGS